MVFQKFKFHNTKSKNAFQKFFSKIRVLKIQIWNTKSDE